MFKLEQNSIPLIATYLGLMGLSVFMFFYARTFPGASMGPAGPGFFPQVVAVILFVLSGLGVVQAFRTSQEKVVIPPQVVGAMTISIAYIGLMYYVGYYISTFVFVFIVMWLSRQAASSLIVLRDSIAILIISYLFFNFVVEANLPVGTLFR